MEKVLFIVNPVAGKMTAKPHILDILKIFNNAGLLPTVYTTKCAGDAAEYVRLHAEEYDKIVCCGGDGTLSETISGMVGAGVDKPIGYIPAGSTNDLAMTLGLPTSVISAAENVVNGIPHGLDIGLVNKERTFSYVASFGVFTKASYATPQSVKNVMGHFAYILAGIKELGNVQKYNMKIKCGDIEESGEFIFGAVTNSLSIGGVFKFSKSKVSLNDGNFEVLLVRTPKDMIELGRVVAHLNDGIYDDPCLVFAQHKDVSITCDRPVAWTVDGEFGGEYGGDKADISIENLHNRVRIILPKAE